MQNNELDRYFSIAEACRVLGWERSTVYSRVKTGRLKAPTRKVALRGVHRKIDHDLRDIYLRASGEYQRSG